MRTRSLDLKHGFLASSHYRFHFSRKVGKVLEEREMDTYMKIKIADSIRGQAELNLVNALKYGPYLHIAHDF
jgi:hypothetical protein